MLGSATFTDARAEEAPTAVGLDACPLPPHARGRARTAPRRAAGALRQAAGRARRAAGHPQRGAVCAAGATARPAVVAVLVTRAGRLPKQCEPGVHAAVWVGARGAHAERHERTLGAPSVERPRRQDDMAPTPATPSATPPSSWVLGPLVAGGSRKNGEHVVGPLGRRLRCYASCGPVRSSSCRPNGVFRRPGARLAVAPSGRVPPCALGGVTRRPRCYAGRVADRDAAPAVPEGVYGWTLRAVASGPCATCGTEAGAASQLRRLTPRGWVDVAGQTWCLRCWSGTEGTAGTSTRRRVPGASGVLP